MDAAGVHGRLVCKEDYGGVSNVGDEDVEEADNDWANSTKGLPRKKEKILESPARR